MTNYDEWHDKLEVDFDVNTPWHQFFQQNEERLNFSNAKILEIGCGRGGFANYFLAKYGNVVEKYVAVDYSETAINKALNFMGHKYLNLELRTGDIQNIDFPGGYFDYVFSFETIEHVPKPSVAVKELYRVLKESGILLLTTPNYLGFFGLYRIYLRLKGKKWTEAGQPINKFVLMPKTLFWLKRSGFRNILSESSIISCPSPFSKRVIQFSWKKPRFILKWLGLQSYFVASKL